MDLNLQIFSNKGNIKPFRKWPNIQDFLQKRSFRKPIFLQLSSLLLTSLNALQLYVSSKLRPLNSPKVLSSCSRSAPLHPPVISFSNPLRLSSTAPRHCHAYPKLSKTLI